MGSISFTEGIKPEIIVGEINRPHAVFSLINALAEKNKAKGK
jgi:hypothetical protein